MAEQHDKLAWQIMKAAVQRPLGSVLPLSLVESWLRGETLDAIQAAIAFAVREGWLTEEDHGWMPTPASAEFVRRSPPQAP